jgi:hypothetical protein
LIAGLKLSLQRCGDNLAIGFETKKTVSLRLVADRIILKKRLIITEVSGEFQHCKKGF